MRRFVVVGSKALASPDFLLDDLPGTSGRLDVLVRCVRAALLVSHGVRRDATIYLVLGGGPRAPRSIRVEGAHVEYLRPDERSLATLVKKALAVETEGPAFVRARPGVSVAGGGLDAVLADLGAGSFYVLEEGAPDLRGARLGADAVFFLGDHTGLHPATRADLAARGAQPLAIGPIGVHADDAVAITSNELDRRSA